MKINLFIKSKLLFYKFPADDLCPDIYNISPFLSKGYQKTK